MRILGLLYIEGCVWTDLRRILSMTQCSNWPNSSAGPAWMAPNPKRSSLLQAAQLLPHASH